MVRSLRLRSSGVQGVQEGNVRERAGTCGSVPERGERRQGPPLGGEPLCRLAVLQRGSWRLPGTTQGEPVDPAMVRCSL